MSLNSITGLQGRFNLNRHSWQLTLSILCFSLLSGCAAVSGLQAVDEQTLRPLSTKKAAYNKSYKIKGKTYSPIMTASGYKEKGIASWYGAESGNRTASGDRFNPRGLTAAHKTLPIPSKVRVTNMHNGRYVDVVINDRGPFSRNRLIDLSQGAAEQIGMRGLTEVTVEYLGG